jgi:phage terminase small subunit
MPVLKNARHERFAQNVVKGLSATEAYEKAGYKPSEAHASRLAGNGKVRARVAELMAPAVEATEATVERVLRELTRLAFYDMTAVLDVDDGKITLRDPTSLPEDLRRAIVGIKPVQIGDTLQYECKFADKQRALDSLARHLQMFKDTVIVENVFRIVSEMEDDELDRRLTELERAFGQATTLDPASVH